jgi:hypothetical protein
LDKLDRPNAEIIKSLESLIDTQDLRFTPSQKEISLGDVLWICQQQFKSLDVNQFGKRIFLFSSEEDPMQGDEKERKVAYERAKNMRSEGIEIELFLMPHPHLDKPDYDIRKFYYENEENCIIMPNEEYGDVNNFEAAYHRIQDLSRRIRLKEFRKRVHWKMSLLSNS